jgi:NAD-dependent dihydropyrimidine dehydrogenase PreA subunit
MGKLIYLKGVVTLELNEEKCVGCGMCPMVCPHEVLVMSNGHARIADRDACMECGACARNCPTEAVTVQAGVGCAAAVISAVLGGGTSSCCCTVEPGEASEASAPGPESPSRSTCC